MVRLPETESNISDLAMRLTERLRRNTDFFPGSPIHVRYLIDFTHAYLAAPEILDQTFTDFDIASAEYSLEFEDLLFILKKNLFNAQTVTDRNVKRIKLITRVNIPDPLN